MSKKAKEQSPHAETETLDWETFSDARGYLARVPRRALVEDGYVRLRNFGRDASPGAWGGATRSYGDGHPVFRAGKEAASALGRNGYQRRT
jgi:hypothetical protein